MAALFALSATIAAPYRLSLNWNLPRKPLLAILMMACLIRPEWAGPAIQAGKGRNIPVMRRNKRLVGWMAACERCRLRGHAGQLSQGRVEDALVDSPAAFNGIRATIAMLSKWD